MMIRIDRQQKKIIGIFVIALFFLIILWFAIYIPQRNKLITIRQDLKNTEAQIAQITALTGGQEVGLAALKLRRKLDTLEDKFMDSEREIINSLSNEAAKFKIIVKSIDPKEKLDYKIDAEIQGYHCQRLPISMKLSTEFKNLGQYLHFLENNLPLLTTIEKLQINGHGKGVVNIDVTLDLLTYLLKEAQ